METPNIDNENFHNTSFEIQIDKNQARTKLSKNANLSDFDCKLIN
jgi:hypothetical protein